VRQLHEPDESVRMAALEELLRACWRPLLAFAMGHGLDRPTAEDAVQGFIETLIRRESLKTVSQEKGRFRSFMLAGFRNHLVSLYRRQFAQIRGGGMAQASLEALAESGADYAEGGSEGSGLRTGGLNVEMRSEGALFGPEIEFDRHWAYMILQAAAEDLRQEMIAQGRTEMMTVLEPFIFGANECSYQQAAERLGVTLPSITLWIHRLRKRRGVLIRERIASTLPAEASDAELRQEIRYLLSIIESRSP
jgi:RNA polymerase sigma factor (sigma-70 family)